MRVTVNLAIGLMSVCVASAQAQTPQAPAAALQAIQTIVVIYAENRSFDNLYGLFPGANGLANATEASTTQRDRDGSVLKELPPIWTGLTGKGVKPPITQAMTEHLANKPFAIDDAQGFNIKLEVMTRDLWHRFYQNQMQINGGRNDSFVAYADSGGLAMGYYDGSRLPMWDVAKRYTLADNFFMGAFGGSFLNHLYLACACAPVFPDADKNPSKPSIAVVDADASRLKLAANSPPSAMDGPPKFVADGNMTPDLFAVNTMQPPYQPSANKPKSGDPLLADPASPTTLPPQTMPHIGTLLSAKGVGWAWYGGAWQAALDAKPGDPDHDLVYHHESFNYFTDLAPGTPARAEHLLDGGRDGVEFIKAIDAGKLPPVAFYKPQGRLDEHAGYTDVEIGDRHLADLIAHLERSPQWANMLVVVTYDENGGWWDHVAPPKADRWGPGTRIPAIIVSPLVKKGFVDHTPYDTGSILRLISHRFDLPLLDGIKQRDDALKASGQPPMGDLSATLAP